MVVIPKNERFLGHHGHNLTKTYAKGLLVHGDSNGLFEMGKLGKISPVAWQHINFYGRFEFVDITTTFNFDEFIRSVDLEAVFNEKDQGEEGRMEI